ncbi:MAG: hypothetical protein H6626_03290 [Pseudobdellovibrionaceae bacterium]|nr:hypothetical protein [Bdellovibrionales bacterium]USN48126.1 MAG: hypothetical protein H6626_03290 [Pseudobdellovibrionaceae bacterium]
MSKVLDFIFGKSPKIFDKDGQVRHELGKQTWENWKNRYIAGEEFNWKNHSGTKAKTHRKSQ